MRYLVLLLCFACADRKPADTAVLVEPGPDPTSPTADPGDTDPGGTPDDGTPDDGGDGSGGGGDGTGSAPVDPSDTGGTTAPGGAALQPGFESELVDVFGCIGAFHAVSADETIALSFEANDLAGAAFVAGQDTTYTLDLAVDGWRLEVRVGSNLAADLCGSTGTPVVDASYVASSGTAVLDVWPHPNQAEQTEGALTLSDAVLEAPGLADVTLVALDIPRMVFGGL